MTYSERFSDQERNEIYAELVMSAMAHYPSSEGAALAELLSRDHAEVAGSKANLRHFSWRSLFHLPLVRMPSLT